MYYAYILKSLKDQTYYYGSTQNLHQRLKDHNKGKVRYTKGHKPYELHYFEQFEEKSKAVERKDFLRQSKDIIG